MKNITLHRFHYNRSAERLAADDAAKVIAELPQMHGAKSVTATAN